MTTKVFLTYTPEGKIIAQTFEEEIYFLQRIAKGELVLEIPSQINYKTNKIDVATMTVVPKTPEEIAADTPQPVQMPEIILPPNPPLGPTGPIPSGS
jgi:hypothetical protein